MFEIIIPLPIPKSLKVFAEKIAPNYIGNDRVDILMKNTDFGVGGESEEQTND